MSQISSGLYYVIIVRVWKHKKGKVRIYKMGVKERPVVSTCVDGGKYFEQEYESFYLKAYVPVSPIRGQIHNYTFRAPLLLVFEEKKQTIEEAIDFAKATGLADIAADNDASVLFIYPTCEGGWKNATEKLYIDVIGEVKMDPVYEDGIVALTDFFTREFKGYFIRGAKFRADIYSYGESADYVAKNLLKKIDGEFLWGPGEITPAMCSMERLSVVPDVQRKDIAVLSVGNKDEINKAFDGCENLLIKSEADYKDDFKKFVRKFKMWCGVMQLEPDFEELDMAEETGSTMVKTDSRNVISPFKDQPEHEVGYFAYYNNGIFDNGPVPLLLGFHGGGDSAMYLTFVSGWYALAHRHNILYVAIENHQFVTALEVMQIIDELKKRYNIDEKRIYAGGFSMGCGKTWDLYQECPHIFAGFMPCSALFPLRNNPFSPDLGDKLNMTVSVPMFYSGGEESFLTELPWKDVTGLERIQYLAEVNKLKKKFDKSFEEKDSWENPMWSVSGDRTEKFYNEERDSYLTVNYYDSEDGICRTALASVSGQNHECREHSIECAWQFISKFTK